MAVLNVSPARPCIVALGDLPSSYLDNRLQSHQGMYSTTSCLPIVLYMRQWLLPKALEWHGLHRQASWKRGQSTLSFWNKTYTIQGHFCYHSWETSWLDVVRDSYLMIWLRSNKGWDLVRTFPSIIQVGWHMGYSNTQEAEAGRCQVWGQQELQVWILSQEKQCKVTKWGSEVFHLYHN